MAVGIRSKHDSNLTYTAHNLQLGNISTVTVSIPLNENEHFDVEVFDDLCVEIEFRQATFMFETAVLNKQLKASVHCNLFIFGSICLDNFFRPLFVIAHTQVAHCDDPLFIICQIDLFLFQRLRVIAEWQLQNRTDNINFNLVHFLA